MIRQFQILFILCAFTHTRVDAQSTYWQPISSQINGIVYDLLEDTASDVMYIAGGGINGFYTFDGTSVASMGSGLCPGQMRVIAKYGSTIFLGGNCPGHFLMKWNGSNWDTVGVSANQQVSSMYVFNGELYVGGLFTQIGGTAANGLAKFDGTNWSAVNGFPFSYNYGVNSICAFNGELYIGGTFGNSSGGVMNIARYDGTQWLSVGGGVSGNMSSVDALETYNNKLYLGGIFTASDGNPGNYIMSWDGVVLEDVGGGVMGVASSNGQIYDLLSHDNSLYVCGAFYTAGGAWAQYLAKWDGINWCGFGDSLNNIAITLGTYRDSLFMGGAFSLIDTCTVSCLAVWNGGGFVDTCGNATGMSDQVNTPFISLHPNPASEIITFQFSDAQESRSIIIYDQLGREVWLEETDESSLSISVQKFTEGIYFYSILEQRELKANGKFVVAH